MKHSVLLAIFLGALGTANISHGADKPVESVGDNHIVESPKPQVEPLAPVTLTPLADAKGKKVRVVAPKLFDAPRVTRSLKIAVYFGGGAGKSNSQLLVTAAERLEGATAIAISPEELSTVNLSQFDILVFAGGSGSGQARAIGENGLNKVRDFVRNGGGYLGICAGAYLACSGYDWSLGLINAKTRSRQWQRGGGAVGLQLSEAGQQIFGKVEEKFPVRYNNGPIIEPFGSESLPSYQTVLTFKDELAENNTPVGLMKDTPAAVTAIYGKGRVLAISPHFEGTKNMEDFLPTGLVWLGEK